MRDACLGAWYEVDMTHSLRVSVGDQVYVGDNLEEVGAVRQVERDHLVVYIENAGDFRVEGTCVRGAHDGKVILDPETLDPKLAEAVARAHSDESL
jgi:hypothetical protein